MSAEFNMPFGNNEEEAFYYHTITNFLDLCEMYGMERVMADAKLIKETKQQSRQGIILP